MNKLARKNTISMRTIKMHELVGRFAENKDLAKSIRQDVLWPAFREGRKVTLNFSQVDDATQSFIHALISQLIRDTQGEALDMIYFKHCNSSVKQIINMVVDYMTEG